MKNNPKILFSLLAGTCLAACTTTKDTASLSNGMTKNMAIKANSQSDLVQANTAAQYHQIARAYHKKKKLDMASIAYQKALSLDKSYTPSMTGLATIYAEQDLLLLAVPLFEEVVALKPSKSHLNNLGYAYYLANRYEEAESTIRQSLALDPNYKHAQKNLDLVVMQLAGNNVKEGSINQVSNDQQVSVATSLMKEVNVLDIAAETAEIEPNAPIVPPLLVKKSDAVYELKLPSNDVVADANLEVEHLKIAKDDDVSLNNLPDIKPNATPAITALTYGAIRFEHKPVINKLFDLKHIANIWSLGEIKTFSVGVINGNGLKGIAGAVAEQLNLRGIEVVKTSDAKRFNKLKTHIQYKTGYRQYAVHLNHSLLNKPHLVKNNALTDEAPIKLVLGRDLTGRGS